MWFRKKSELAPVVDPYDQRINNFPDWMGPMVVKELRQGVRARGFTVTIWVSQLLLVLLVLSLLLSGDRQSGGEQLTGSLFTVYVILLLFVQPLRSLGAVFVEIKANTLPLMQLTRMNAGRIVLGKWVSLFVQSLLLAVGLLPYFVVRYFLGGMDVTSNLLAYCGVLFASGVLTAVGVGMSASRSALIRGLVGFGLGLGLLILMQTAVFYMTFGGGSVVGGAEWGKFVGVVGCGVYLGYLFLELGAGGIAPPAENRQTLLRLVSLGFVTLLGGVAWFWELELNHGLMRVLLVVLGLCVLSSVTFVAPRTVRKFMRFGWLAKPLGRVLYPGWASGVAYLVLVAAYLLMWKWLVCRRLEVSFDFSGEAYQLSTGLGILGFCLVLIQLLFRTSSARFGLLVLFLSVQGLVLAFAAIVYEMVESLVVLSVGGLVPMAQIYFEGKFGLNGATYWGFMAMNFVYFGLSMWLGRKDYSYYREMEAYTVKLVSGEAKEGNEGADG